MIYFEDGFWRVKRRELQPFDVVDWEKDLAAFNECIRLNGGVYATK